MFKTYMVKEFKGEVVSFEDCIVKTMCEIGCVYNDNETKWKFPNGNMVTDEAIHYMAIKGIEGAKWISDQVKYPLFFDMLNEIWNELSVAVRFSSFFKENVAEC